MDFRMEDRTRIGFRLSVAERETNPQYLRFLGRCYGIELDRLVTSFCKPDAKRLLSRVRRLQELVFINLPWLEKLMTRQSVAFEAEVTQLIKQRLPLSHALVQRFELTGDLSLPVYRGTAVTRLVYKRGFCESCFRANLLFTECVPGGEPTCLDGAPIDGYVNRQRQIVRGCSRCEAAQAHRKQLVVVCREAILKRFRCYACRQSVLVTEAVSLGEPFHYVHMDRIVPESYAGRWRYRLSECLCDRHADKRFEILTGQLADPEDLWVWHSHKKSPHK